MSRCAWVTLATNDSYSLGALVVGYSLKKVSTEHQLAVLITPGVSQAMQNKLKSVFDVVQLVNVLDSKDSANLAVLKRPELGITFTKLHCWNLTQFEKCVFLDADVLILRNCDELFERDEFSAAPDVGWPDCFNSGVFVFTPSASTYGKLIEFAATSGSFDGGDQGLLNSYFSDWSTSDSTKRLPFLYNTASTATYSYLPAFKKFNQEIKIIHFIGETKPWLQHFNSLSQQVSTPQGYNHLQGFLQLWWDLFCEKVHPELNEQMNLSWLFDGFIVQKEISSEPTFNGNPVVEESLSYDPYLIEYHEETQTFTYTDPWHTHDNNSYNEMNTNNNNNDIQYNESPPPTPSQPQTSSTQHIIECNDFNYNHAPNNNNCGDFNSTNDVLEESQASSLHSPTPSVPESGIAGALANVTLGTERSSEQIALEDNFRRFNWEAGQIDYLGEDSFSNIWKRIQTTIDTPTTKANAPKPVATSEPPVVATVSSSAVKDSPVFEAKKTEVILKIHSHKSPFNAPLLEAALITLSHNTPTYYESNITPFNNSEKDSILDSPSNTVPLNKDEHESLLVEPLPMFQDSSTLQKPIQSPLVLICGIILIIISITIILFYYLAMKDTDDERKNV